MRRVVGGVVVLAVAVVGAAAGREPLRLESRRTVGWGYGCGGHCAVRTDGKSTVTLVSDGSDVHLVDEGTQTMNENHEGGGVKQETRWSYRWHGRAKLGATELQFDVTGGGTCARTEESSDAGDGGAVRKSKLACPKAPRKLSLTCRRKELDLDGAVRAAWECSSRERSPGTELPWMFGVDQAIDTVVGGEPRPETSYVLRATK